MIGEEIVSKAQSYIGVMIGSSKEGFNSSNFNREIKSAGWQSGQAWCMYFSKLCWILGYEQMMSEASSETQKSKIRFWQSKAKRLTGSSRGSFQIATKLGFEISSSPVVGAIAIWTGISNGKYTWSGHAGIVSSVSGTGFTSIEGNVSGGTGQRRSRVVSTRSYSYAAEGTPHMNDLTVEVGEVRSRRLRGFIIPKEPDPSQDPLFKPDETKIENKPVASKEYIEHVITIRDVDTINNQIGVGDSNGLILAFGKEFTYNDFLSYDGKTGLSNKDRIEEHWILEADRKENKIKIGTVVVLPLSRLLRRHEDIVSPNDISSVVDIPFFFETERQKLVQDPAYNPYSFKGSNIITSTPSAIVWIYSRSFDKVLDLTPFVNHVKMTSYMQTSAFEISLNYMNAVKSYKESNVYFSVQEFDDETKNPLSYFSRLISPNDIVFLKFESVSDYAISSSFEIEPFQLFPQIYDLLGLVDQCIESRNFNTKDVTLSVTGRDFSKLFEDDEAKFFPLSLVPAMQGRMILGTSELGNKLLRRTLSGEYLTLFGKSYKKLGELFSYYLNIVSNLGVLPQNRQTTLFAAYTEREDKDGVYQLVKLNIDKNVANKRIVDPNATAPDGNLISLFNNICQFPFVECIFETLGNSYNIIVRQPPFSYSSITDYLGKTGPFMNIEGYRIQEMNLSFTQEVYTWFKLTPNQTLLGSNNIMGAQICPIIQLDEYVNLWGSKCLDISTNYSNLETVEGEKTLQDFSSFHKKALDDLVYLVEISDYLPFTRTGTILLSSVDRTIKKGTWIRILPTREIFYVESVTQDVAIMNDNIESSTLITVSRGMVEKYIEGVSIDIDEYNNEGSRTGSKVQKKVSYFDIVDLKRMKETLYEAYLQQATNSNMTSDRTSFVDKSIFNFFVQKKQYEV